MVRNMSDKQKIGCMKKWFMSCQIVLSMILVQVFATGMQLLSRVSLVHGTYIFALIAYRYIVAAICVVPFALYFERGLEKKFNWKVWFWLFVNALVGMTMSLGLFYYGLRDTSAAYSVNFLNLIPICTFFTSIIFRMESLKIGTWGGRAKFFGAILCVGGALTTSLFKGKEFHIGLYHSHHEIAISTSKTHMFFGTLFLVGSCCCYTAWFIIQVKLIKVFPLKYWGTMLSCVMAAIQSALIGLCINSNIDAWRLGWNLQLITILFTGVLGTAAIFCLISWTITIKGPTYPSMFNPLALIFVAISEAIILGEPLRVGTLLGMILILLGLYYFLWGKGNEMQSSPHTNVAADVLSTRMVDGDPSVSKSTVAVAPISSPYDSVLEIDKAIQN
ncbi:unnamed protein product [Lathyrus oleraceus]